MPAPETDSERGPAEAAGPRHRSTPKKPVPTAQLAILLLIQFAEPVTSTVIYPFINQFVGDTGVMHGDEKKTGYYAGLIVS